MYTQLYILILLTVGLSMNMMAQEIIELPINKYNEAVTWPDSEKDFFSDTWQTRVITNVSKPTMIVHRPATGIANGTSVVICPGGGLYAHSIDSEGHQVAEWLAKRGVTAFVLKYRLVPTGEDGTKDLMTDGPQVPKRVEGVLPLSIDDALNAITHVRTHASDYEIDPNKIGLMGFSAGGAVTMGATYNYDQSNRPDFIAPIYAWMIVVPKTKMPADAPPIFVACASDDPLRLAPASVKLYQEWLEGNKPAELHMYANGGHGFGMRELGLNSDKWIEHFGEWLRGQGLMQEN